MSEELKTAVGIDLGTTQTAIAVIDETGTPRVIPNGEGHPTTPSVVFFESMDSIVVGETAQNALISDPEKVVDYAKRNMGVPGVRYMIEGQEFAPEQISALVLKKVIGDAERELGKKITNAVIAVPAYFDDPRRKATEQAGRIAGVEVDMILDEPTAAAFAYGIEKGRDQTVLVYDLGGGTFDVSIIESKDHKFKVVRVDGDSELGGKDWNDRLAMHLIRQWEESTGRTAPESPGMGLENEILALAEKAKKDLSHLRQTKVSVVIGGERALAEVSREKFEELTSSLLERTVALTKKVIEDGGKLGCGKIDKILLVGGSTRMPQVKVRLEQEFDPEILQYRPDEAVAVGASLVAFNKSLQKEMAKMQEEFAARKDGASVEVSEEMKKQAREAVAQKFSLRPEQMAVSDFEFENRTSRAYGVEAVDAGSGQDTVAFLIGRNAPLPASGSSVFGTEVANQRNAQIKVLEAVDHAIRDLSLCTVIARTSLELPPGLGRGSEIEVSFRIDEQGILHAVAKELSHGGTVNVAVDRGDSVLSEKQVIAASDKLRKLSVI